jgi:hypothetical protein
MARLFLPSSMAENFSFRGHETTTYLCVCPLKEKFSAIEEGGKSLAIATLLLLFPPVLAVPLKVKKEETSQA